MIRRLSGSLVGASGPCPNIIAPRQGRETCRPDAPRLMYSIDGSRVSCVPSTDVLIKYTLLPRAGFRVYGSGGNFMEQLAGRVAVVTGAGSGIGRGIAAALAAAGTHVMIADIDAAATRETAAQLVGAGVEVVAAECDVTDREAVEALASKAWAHFGHVDIAVNNAGVFPPVRRAINIDERDARWVLEVNLMGAWYGCSAFGRRFTDQGTPAHILNTRSAHHRRGAHARAGVFTAGQH